MRVANYYRVSTKLQEDRFSLAAQKTELHSYVKKQNWNFIDEFVDVESGGKLDKLGLNALLDVVENGRVDVVLCMDQDRLSRLDTVSWEYLKSVLRDNNVKIAEPTGTITDLSNEDDVFMSDLRNLMAQREKNSVVRRMMYGKRQRLREGKGWGRPPFEYYYEDDAYYVKSGWSWVIPKIDDLYLNKNYGMTKITNSLNEISKTPTGKSWNEHLVSTRLTSKCFHGYQEMTFSNGETISAKVYEPMRTEETYNKIQEIRKERGNKYTVYRRTSDKNINLLKYVPLKCGHCGRALYTSQQGARKMPVYITYHGRSKSLKTGISCDLSMNVKRYEYNLMLALKEILTDENLSRKYIEFETNEDELSRIKRDIKKREKDLNNTTTSKDKLLDLYLSADNTSKEVYLNKEKEFTSKIDVLSSEIDKLKRKKNIIDKKEWNYESLYEYIQIADNLAAELTRHEQADVMKGLFTKGVLTEKELTLTTEIYNGIPIDIKIPVEDCTRRVNRWIRQDEREDKLIYRY